MQPAAQWAAAAFGGGVGLGSRSDQVRNEGSEISAAELLAFYVGKVAKWWIPDDVQFIEDMPHTATGKIQKTALRDMFADYQFPG